MKYFILLFCLFSTSLYARGDRTGFNFGTTIRALSDQSNLKVDPVESNKVSSTSVSPFLGYTFGQTFNLGLSLLAETSHSEHSIQDVDITRTQTNDTSYLGGYLSGRILFGRVFFLDGAVGGIRASMLQKTQTIEGATSFTGSISNNKYQGTGLTYKLGGGIEVPIGLDFYLTSAYYNRVIVIQRMTGTQKASLNDEQAELVFGLTHYL